MSQKPEEKEKEKEVLPKNVIPTHYFLSITPDLVKHFRFFGRVEIDLLVKEDSDFITLNTVDLSLLKIQIRNGTEVLDIKIAD
ncbi:Aminopeptidase N precursor, partial [Reticulomyxa filosa]